MSKKLWKRIFKSKSSSTSCKALSASKRSSIYEEYQQYINENDLKEEKTEIEENNKISCKDQSTFTKVLENLTLKRNSDVTKGNGNVSAVAAGSSASNDCSKKSKSEFSFILYSLE